MIKLLWVRRLGQQWQMVTRLANDRRWVQKGGPVDPQDQHENSVMEVLTSLAGDGRVKKGGKLQFTPNGTRIPEGPPPSGDDCNMPSCPPPPVPPFPIPPTVDAALHLTDKVDFTVYEACEDSHCGERWVIRFGNPPMKNLSPLKKRRLCG